MGNLTAYLLFLSFFKLELLSLIADNKLLLNYLLRESGWLQRRKLDSIMLHSL